ncbi:MAG: argininosuccinate lyase [Peptococcaceae bacterium]|nr:argininosuccinate lyase [Peptococcaceae bacterium]
MSGRLEADPSKEFRNIVLGHELSEIGDSALTPLLYVNIAHVKMLSKQKLIPAETAKNLLAVLKEIGEQGLAVLDTDHAEDLYFALEQKLISVLGMKEAGNIHMGRSRNDIYSTVYRMIVREKLLEVSNYLLELYKEVLGLAEAHKDTIMPGYTHTQHAQAVTLGYYFLGFLEVLTRDMQRIKNAWELVNKSPLGAAAITTTRFPLDREYTSDILGFDSIVYNGYDAISGRDYVNDAALALNTIVTDISRVVADLMSWNMSEFAFIEIPDEFAVISSIMPQKKNPAAFEFLRSAASWVLGDTIGVISSPKGVSYSDIRDATKYLYSPLWHSFEVTANVIKLFSEILPGIKWNKQKMLTAASQGYATMTDLADHFVEEYHITFREAHHIVAYFVRTSIAEGKKSDELSVEALNKICLDQGFDFTLTQEELDKVLDPKECLRRRVVAGGTSDEQLQIMLVQGHNQYQAEQEWYKEKTKQIKRSEEKMFS